MSNSGGASRLMIWCLKGTLKPKSSLNYAVVIILYSESLVPGHLPHHKSCFPILLCGEDEIVGLGLLE